MRLDEEVVDLRCDDVRVLRDDRREDVGVADRIDDGLARLIAAGQHQAQRVACGRCPDQVRVDDRPDHVLAVARDDDE